MNELQREEQIFHQALAIAAPDERERFLQQACATRPLLHERLLALLAAHDSRSPLASAGKTAAWADFDHEQKIGRFQVIEEIGRGGFGIVLLAYDPQRQENVALKIPRPEMLLSPAARDRFLLEAKAVASLAHPNIVQALEVGEVGSMCYIASTYCAGTSLDRFLAECRQQITVALTPKQVAWLMQQLAWAVHHVHEHGILHRDIKPSNVLLLPQSAEAAEDFSLPFIPQLADFGLAKLVESGLEETTSSTMLGTPLYMAPEQAECRRDAIGPATDVYALGVILYELLTGSPPFVGLGFVNLLDRVRTEPPVPPRRLQHDIPAPLEQICLKCLAKEPDDRYQSGEALALDLQRFLQGKPIQGRGPSLWRRLQQWSKNPQRLRDAGLWSMALNAGMLCWMAGNAVVLITLGTSGRPISKLAALSSLVAGLILHMPMILFGWQTLRRRRWAMYAGLVGALGLWSMAFFPLWGSSTPFDPMYPDRLALWNVFWFLTILFSVQLGLYLAALRSSYANRR